MGKSDRNMTGIYQKKCPSPRPKDTCKSEARRVFDGQSEHTHVPTRYLSPRSVTVNPCNALVQYR